MASGIKRDNRGHEGRAEYLVSKFMEFTSLKTSEYVTYEEGTINGSSGCRSRNFLTGEEELITFYRLYYNEVGKDLSKVIGNMDNDGRKDRICGVIYKRKL